MDAGGKKVAIATIAALIAALAIFLAPPRALAVASRATAAGDRATVTAGRFGPRAVASFIPAEAVRPVSTLSMRASDDTSGPDGAAVVLSRTSRTRSRRVSSSQTFELSSRGDKARTRSLRRVAERASARRARPRARASRRRRATAETSRASDPPEPPSRGASDAASRPGFIPLPRDPARAHALALGARLPFRTRRTSS